MFYIFSRAKFKWWDTGENLPTAEEAIARAEEIMDKWRQFHDFANNVLYIVDANSKIDITPENRADKSYRSYVFDAVHCVNHTGSRASSVKIVIASYSLRSVIYVEKVKDRDKV